MNSGGVIGHSASCSTTGSSVSATADQGVPQSTTVTPAEPRAQAAQATSASPWTSANGNDPRPSSTTAPKEPGASGTSYESWDMVHPTYDVRAPAAAATPEMQPHPEMQTTRKCSEAPDHSGASVSGTCDQEARTSSRRASALSSLVCSASASSETRI